MACPNLPAETVAAFLRTDAGLHPADLSGSRSRGFAVPRADTAAPWAIMADPGRQTLVEYRRQCNEGQMILVHIRALAAVDTGVRRGFGLVVLVLAGTGRYRDWRGIVQPLGPGSTYQHPPRLRHRVDRAAPQSWEEWSLRLPEGLWRQFAALSAIDPEQPVAAPGLASGVADHFVRLADLFSDPRAGDAECLYAVHGLLVAAGMRARPPDERGVVLERLARELAEGAGEPALAAAARSLAIGPAQLRRLFRARFGCAPTSWRLRGRIQRAQVLLRDRGLGAAAVAAQLGFSSPAAFSAQFRRLAGESPGAWARRSAPLR